MLDVSPLAGAVLAAKYWPNEGVTSRARRSRPRRWLSRTVVEASVQSVVISIASPFTMRASSSSACTVVAARRRTSPSLISEQRSRPPMSATKALTRSRKRRAVAERPSRPGNRLSLPKTRFEHSDGVVRQGPDTRQCRRTVRRAVCRAHPSRAKRGSEPHCTTRQHNAHRTEEREVLYRWHPWFGRRVFVHEVSFKGGVRIFRCAETAQGVARCVEVPEWMFDRATCCGMAYAESTRVG